MPDNAESAAPTETVTVDRGDLIMLHAMARSVPGVSQAARDMLARTKRLLDAAWAEEAAGWAREKADRRALTREMLERLDAAGIQTRSAAVAMSINERDKVLDVAAWSGYEDAAWEAALNRLQHNDGPGGAS